MLTVVFLCAMLVNSVGYEGYTNGKWHFGIYTPSAEYGYVVTNSGIYLDTVFEKK